MNIYNSTIRRSSFLFSLLLLTSIIFAQSSTNISGPIPPSAASMSFGKYADTPLNTNNGTTVVNIPLGSISDGPLSHTVSMSYLTGGIRAGELASTIGLGWTLNAGGVVGRTVRGIPDDQANGYYHTGDSVVIGDADDVANGLIDAEPDLFYYNVGGMTGKFIIDKNGNPFQIPKTDNKIEWSEPIQVLFGKAIMKFLITSPDGTRYHFGTESTGNSPTKHQHVQIGVGGMWYIDLWKLEKIESFDGKHSIDFEYTNVNQYKPNFNNDCFVLKNLDNSTVTNNCNGSQTDMYIGEDMISKISSSIGEIDFSVENRLDLINWGTTHLPKRINKIEFNNGSQCYKYDFTQSYFDTDAPSGPLDKKLKLDQIQRKDCQETIEEEPYTFTYIDGQIGGTNSKAIDHWGYFTGDLNRNTFDHNIPLSSYQGASYGIGNRSSNSGWMDNGALKKVTYPTKGSTEYFYEANKAPMYSLDSGDDLTPILNLISCDNNITAACCGSNTNNTTTVISQEMINTGNLKITTDYADSFCSPFGTSIPVDFVIKNSSGTTIHSVSFNLLPPYNTPASYEETLLSVGITTPGSYQFILSSDDGQAILDVQYVENTITEQTVGGLRIRRIETYDGLNFGEKIVRTFTYYKPGTNESSGRLNSQPKYVHFLGNHQKVLFSSTTLLPLNSEAGYHINYEHITESKNGNGHIKYEMNVETYLTSQIPSYPAKPNLFLVNNGTSKETQILDQQEIIESSTSVSRNDDLYNEAVGTIYAAKDLGSFTLRADYDIRTNVYRPLSVTNIMDGITSTTNYEYHPQNKILSPYKIKTTNSDGKEHESRFFYTVDYWDATVQHTLKPSFINRNMIGIPFENFKYVDNQILDGTRTVFRNFTDAGQQTSSSYATNRFPRPYETQRWERTWFNGNLQSGSWEHKSYMLEYNNNGLLYRHQADGWNETQYTYNSDKLLIKKAFNGHETEYAYYPNSSLLQQTTAVDGTTMSYIYDDLMRLDTKTDDCLNISTTYNYSLNSNNITSQKNYVESTTTHPTAANSALGIIRSRTYIDGLGRGIQSVRQGQDAETQQDILVSTVYDNQGRVKFSYQPTLSSFSDGRYVAPTSSWLYSTSEYYNSPLNRVKRTKPHGWYWTNYEYGNNASDNVKINGTTTNYGSAELFKKTIIDPDNKKSIAFTDKIGRTILSRHTNNAETDNLDTYTLYDDKNRTTYVLPPGVPSTSSTYDDLYYHYEYDGEDLMTTKKIPGAAEVSFKYTDRDLLGGYQDGMLAAENKWYTYNYDLFGRSTEEGFYAGTPTTNFTPTDPLIKIFYGTNSYDKDKVAHTETKVLRTASDFINSYNVYTTCGVLDNQYSNNHIEVNDPDAITTSYIYDGGLNVTETNSTIIAHGNTKTIVNTQTYDHAGRPNINSFKVDAGPTTTLSDLAYNAREDIIYKWQGNSNNQFLQQTHYTYKDHGPLKSINAASLQGGQQAWDVCTLPNLADPASNYTDKDLFHQELYYDTSNPGTNNTIQKNGNISSTRWQVKGRAEGNYTYVYDTHNRLTSANYKDRENGVVTNSSRYTTGYTYDDRGNLTNLLRFGMTDADGCLQSGFIDNLTYQYSTNSNQLLNVTDSRPSPAGDEGYHDLGSGQNTYDANGNMTAYPDKQITITYNHLNLPEDVILTGGRGGQNALIKFIYDAAGNLLQRFTTSYSPLVYSRTYDYISGVEYEDGTVQKVLHAEGYVGYANDTPVRYNYTINDHLGNTRLVYSDINENGKIEDETEILQENHYYPFGMKMKGPWMGDENEYRYKYNGIEEIDDFGLDLSFARYRTLDPEIGRWLQVDPKGEVLKGINPYNSMANNPISFNDPEGDIIPALIVGAAIGVATNGISNAVQGNNFFQGAGQAALFGAIGGGISSVIGGAAAGMSGIGKAAFQMGTHGISGGIMSKAQGGSFGSGFLSGALSSGMSSSASALGVGNAGMIGVGGLSGGIGSSIAGGNFWSGAGQGLITSGLNHAAHSGALGKGIAMGLHSGKLRHWFSPDANVRTAGISLEFGGTIEVTSGEIEIRHGQDKGTHPYAEISVGAGAKAGLAGVINLEQMYYFGSKASMTLDKFYGGRTQVISSAGLGGYYSLYGAVGNKSKGGGRVVSWGTQFGAGVGGGAGINYGYSGPSFQAIKDYIHGN